MSRNVFSRLTVDTHLAPLFGVTATVSWAIEPDFVAPGPWTFTLQRGFSPTEVSWEPIATTVDQPWLYDNRPIGHIVSAPVYYRVTLTDGNGVIYYSQAQTSKAYWSRYDWTLAKEIVRKETLLLRKKTGVQGWLLKRRYFGYRCSSCTDPATGQLLRSDCVSCYGTGIDQGYYPKIEFWITMNASQRMRKLTAEQGVIAATVESARALAYPTVEANDVWVHGHTNVRYFIGADSKAVARHRGIDLVTDLVLNQVPEGHIIYKLPVPCH